MFGKIDFGQFLPLELWGRDPGDSIRFSNAELFTKWTQTGGERFTFDWSTEMVGYDKSVDYFGRPGERRGHEAVEIAALKTLGLQKATLSKLLLVRIIWSIFGFILPKDGARSCSVEQGLWI